MLVRQVTVHQNEDKSIDISFDMNGAFNHNIMEDVTSEILCKKMRLTLCEALCKLYIIYDSAVSESRVTLSYKVNE